MKYLTFPISLLKPPHQLISALNSIMDYCLYVEAEKYGNIEHGRKVLDITYGYGTSKAYNNGKMLFNSISAGTPKTSIKKKLIFEFYKQDKTEFDKVCFLAYISFRSIIQKQPYTKATNEYLLNRMVGNSSKGGKLPNWIMQYNNEYQLKKIKQAVQLKFGLKYYAYYTRGFWFSFSLPINKLALIAERNKESIKRKKLQSETQKAREQALNKLKNEHDL